MERNKHIQGAYYAEKAMTAFLFAVTCSIALYAFIYMPGYNGFEISDWMINYQGGFVRRGLVGELLFMLEKVKPYNLRYAVIGIDMVFYILSFSPYSGYSANTGLALSAQCSLWRASQRRWQFIIATS